MLLIKNARLWRWRRPHRLASPTSSSVDDGTTGDGSDSSSIMPEGSLVGGWLLVDEAQGVFADVGYDDDEQDGEAAADRVRGYF